MIRPRRALIMLLIARLTVRKAPPRFVSTTAAKSSSLMRMSSVSRVMPAFATTVVTGPSCCSISATAASSDAPSFTSARTVSVPSGPSPLRAVTATRQPSRTKRSAIARPMPRLPPVTRTTLSVLTALPVLTGCLLMLNAGRLQPTARALAARHA